MSDPKSIEVGFNIEEIKRLKNLMGTLENPKKYVPHFKIPNGLIPRIFGCDTFVHIHNPNKDKLDPRLLDLLVIQQLKKVTSVIGL